MIVHPLPLRVGGFFLVAPHYTPKPAVDFQAAGFPRQKTNKNMIAVAGVLHKRGNSVDETYLDYLDFRRSLSLARWCS